MARPIFYSVLFLFLLMVSVDSNLSAQTDRDKIVKVEYEFNMPIKINPKDADSIRVRRNGGKESTESPFDIQDLLYRLHFTMKFTVIGNQHTSTIDLRNPDITGSNFIGKVSTPEVIIFENAVWSSVKEGKKKELKFRDVTFENGNEVITILGYTCHKVLILDNENEVEATAWITNELPPTLVPTPGYRPASLGGAVLAIESSLAGGNFTAINITK